MERKNWIDLLRGICMMAILLDHTEIYYTGSNIINYNLYVVNTLTIFFFLSGYLTYKEKGFNFIHKLKSIVKQILIPYFIFTIIIAFPKYLMHGEEIDILRIIFNIFTGQASWFIAALIISEVIFSVILWISKQRLWILSITSILLFIISTILPKNHQPYFWQFDNALQAILFLYLGYIFHRYEKRFNYINTFSYTILLIILISIIKIYEYKTNVNLLINPINITNYPIFILDTILMILLMVNISKNCPRCKTIEWTGARSIVYYFFCGGCPLIISTLLNKLEFSYNGYYYRVIIAFLLTYTATSLIAWIVYRFFPFLIGRNRI